MKTIELNSSHYLSTPQNYQFVPIGNPDKLFGEGGFLDQLKDRIFKRKSSPLEDFWATLGRQDGKTINWSGNLLCSKNGNDESAGITADEIALLKQLMPTISADNKGVLEKVIILDHTEFGSDPDGRNIRLTLMVDPGEGAIVFFQHTEMDDALSQNGLIEYIHPATTVNYSNNLRDRLDYFFQVPEHRGKNDRLIVKAITFPRNMAETPETVLHRIDPTHRLLKYDAGINDFSEITNGIPDVDRSKKTLLLIHGTFASTAKSYGGLITSNWLKNVINTKLYDQVFALDHPTILAGPDENVAKLLELMGPGKKFSQPIAIITTSRGGLVGKTIVNDANINAKLFTVERVAAQACANGVEYFAAGAKIAKGLGVLKKIFELSGREGLEIFTAIAQISAEIFLAQPGCVAMTPNSAPLKKILDGVPANSAMRYFPVTGNYDPNGFWKKIADIFVSVIYGGEPNDWVVGTKQQAIMPVGNYAYGSKKQWHYDHYLATTYNSMHTKYLNMDPPPPTQAASGIPRDAIMDFLNDPYQNIL
ncbi:MAG: hypothetical protein HY064_16290 [Bacteroidetes bacterium]|nr:hypothetical protein [Bacteroidota bacterium]